jgi:hypothetical protein
MPLGPHDPRAEARRAEAVRGPSAVGLVHEAAGQRDAVSRAVTRDKPGDNRRSSRDNGRRGGGRGRRRHHDCATLRVGDVFLKIDADQTRTDVEVEAMAMAPVPTPEVLWRKPPVLALAALPGTALGRLGEPSTASPAAAREAIRHGLCCPHEDITQCPNFSAGITARLAGRPLSRSHQQLHSQRFHEVPDSF